MAQVTVAHKSPFIAAAVSMTAFGFLTVPAPAQALPMIPLAPACSDYQFKGQFSLNQSNGATVSFDSTGQTATGRAVADTGGPALDLMRGKVGGGIQGRHLEFTIQWDRGPIGHYAGDVDDSGFAHGNTVDVTDTSSTATWDATTPLACMPPAAPPPPPPPPPVQAPPQAPPAPAAKTAEVASDVDVYDAPGGNGKVLGILRADPAPQKVELVGSCQPNDWCQVAGPNVPTGKGFVWGSLKL
jgi:hypothetical protein